MAGSGSRPSPPEVTDPDLIEMVHRLIQVEERMRLAEIRLEELEETRDETRKAPRG